MEDERLTSCIDAELLAAWTAGTLSDADVRLVERHLATCDRCQAVAAALARAEYADAAAPAAVPPAAPAAPNAPSRWFAIAAGIVLTGGIAGLMWWQTRPSSPAPASTVASTADGTSARDVATAPVVPTPAPPVAAESEPPTTPKPASTPETRAARRTAPSSTLRPAAIAAPPPPPPPPAAPPPPAQAATAGTSTAARSATDNRDAWRIVPMTSRGNATTWRVSTTVPGQVERSTDGGETWAQVPLDASVALADAKVLDASAPTASVCWMVGEKGLVVLITDGQTMRRVPFPEPVTLVRVLADSAAAARVITADGRAFVTTDAGLTWQPARF